MVHARESGGVNIPIPDTPEFWVTRGDMKYPRLAGLLDAAHRAGMRSLVTECLYVPNEMNAFTAYFKATVIMDYLSEPDYPLHGEHGRAKTDGDHPLTVESKFTGHGEANKENVGQQVKGSFFRMAESRAIVRALRWAVNSGVAAAEELTDEEADLIAGMRGAASPPKGRGRDEDSEPENGSPRRSEPSRVSDKSFAEMKPNMNRASPGQANYLKGLMKECHIDRELMEQKYGPVENMPGTMASESIETLNAVKHGQSPKKRSALEWLLQFGTEETEELLDATGNY